MMMMMMIVVVIIIITAPHHHRACEIPGIMPATCPFLIHPFSLLLLLGPHLFVGSFSLGSPSSTSPTDRSSLATAGPRGAASIQGGSTSLAASSLLPREKGSPQPSAASVGVWYPTTERDISSDSPAIMTRQKDAESPNTEAKISSSYIHSTDAVSMSGSDKIRTLWTNLTSASAVVTGSATSYTKIIRSVNVAQQLSQMIQTKRASASPNLVGIAESESVTLRKYFPKTPNSSFLEKKHSAAESNHHTAGSWDGDSTMSTFHTPNMDSSATLSQGSERTSHFLQGNFTGMDLAGKGPATQREPATSSGQIQWTSHVTFPIPKSRTSDAKQPDSLARIVLTRSYSSLQTNPDQLSGNSNTERRMSNSDTENMTIRSIPSRGEEKIFQTIRDIRSSQSPHSASAVSKTEMSSNGNKILRTLRDSSSSQNPHSVFTIPSLEMSSNKQKIFQTIRGISSTPIPHSAFGVSKMSSNWEKILRTLRDSSSSQSPHSISSVSSLEVSSSSGLRDSSYVVVPTDSRQMDLSTQDTDKAEATDTHSQSPSATTVTSRMSVESPYTGEMCKAPFCSCSQATDRERNPEPYTGAVEGSDWVDSRSNTERKPSSSHMDSASVSRASVRDEEKSKNATQTFTTANTSSSSKLSVRPEQTREMHLSRTDFVFTEEAFTLSQATTGQNGQQKSSSDTEGIASNFHTQSRSDRSGERMLQTLRHTGSSHHPRSISTATHSGIPSSSGLADTSYVLTPVQTRQRDLSSRFTDFMEAASTHPWDSSQTIAAEDSSRLRSSSNKEKISSSQTDGVSVSGLSKTGEESTLQTVRDVRSSESDTQMSTVANTTISSSSDFAHSFHMKSPEQTDQDLSPGDTDVTEGMLISSHTPPETTVEEENGQSHSSSSTEGILSTYHLNSTSISDLSDLDGERTVRTLRDVSSAHNVTQGSTAWHNETSSSSGLTDSSYLLTSVETDLTPQITDFTEGTSTHLQASSEKTESSDQSSSSSNIETRISHSDQDSASISSLSDRDDETTLQTLREVKDVHSVTQISTTVNANITSSFNIADSSSYTMTPKHTRQMNSSSGDNDFIEEALTYSEAPSETTDTRSRHHALSNFSIEKRATQTESMFSTTVVKDKTFASELSSFDLKNAGSSVIIQTSSATLQSRKENSPSTGMDFTETLEQSLLTTSSKASGYSSSTKDFSNFANRFQTIKGSDAGRRFSIASTDSVYLSTTFEHGAERTLRSLPDNSTSNDAADNNTYNSQTSRSSGGSLTLTSVTETEKHNVSLSEVQSTGPFTEYRLEYSSVVPTSLSPNDSSATGSNHNSTSGSRVWQSYTASTDSSAPFSEGEEQTTQPTINTTVTEETESISLSIENFDSSRSKPPSSKTYSRMTDLSVKVLDISPSSTEAFQILSSSTYSSFKSELSDTGTDYQPMSSTDFGKQNSVSHTDSTYTLTTFARGGERTLLSLPNNSTSPDSSGSSTYLAEISNPSKSVQSLFSSDMDFSENSTEPLAVHSLKTSEYSSTVSEPHTTQFYSESESASTGSLSFSSSSTMLSEQDSLPPAQPSTLFSSAKSSVPSASSAFLLPLSSSPPTSLMTFSPMLSSTEPPTLPFFPSVLPSLSSTPSLLQPSESLETSVSMAEPEGTTGAELHMTGSSQGEYNRQTTVYPLENSTILMATGTSLPTENSEQPANHSSPGTTSQEEKKGQILTLPGISTENVPIMTTSPPYLQEMTTVSEPAKATMAMPLHTTPQKDTFHSSAVTVGKKITKITHTPGRLPTSASTMNYSFTTKLQKVQLSSPTKISYSTGLPTKMMEKSSTTTVKTTVPRIVITSSPYTLTSHKPVQSFPASLVPPKPTTTVGPGSPKISPTPYGKDVDECLSNPCPTLATCTNIRGSFQCICSLGYQMGKGKCNLVRTFVGQFPLTFNATGGTYSGLHQIEGAIVNLLNESLSTLPGYYTSTVKALRQEGTVQISILSTFSMASNVTFSKVISTVQSHIQACKTPKWSCQFFSNLTQLYRAGGLCKHKDPECDKGTSVCGDLDGIAVCQCKPGYFRYNKLDHSCRACEDGYKLENDTCVSCPFGLGGFNCRNPYQLITIVIAAAGGGLLLIMGIALIVTCCQKNKNDISKLIFKSGDFQMSPYAEYPKNPRVQDWGRETIEMQENGSTKNLLQMTDVYYMSTNLRNPELERNGVYPPYTGLPGSRHSCIYPGQYNPSFICDDSRRRDYF